MDKPKHIMLKARYQLQRTMYYSISFICNAQNKQHFDYRKYINGCPKIKYVDGGYWEVEDDFEKIHRFSQCNNNDLKLILITVTHCEYTKYNWIINFNWGNCKFKHLKAMVKIVLKHLHKGISVVVCFALSCINIWIGLLGCIDSAI
jgi:hypothetical protein